MQLARNIAASMLALLSIGTLSGCMSLGTTFDKDPEIDSKMYIGTRTNMLMLASTFSSKMDSEGRGMMIGALPFILLDVPMSFVLDTLFLPYTAQYVAPPHPVVAYGHIVALEGRISEFPGFGHMLQLRPSVYISQGEKHISGQENGDRVHIVQLVLNENLAAEFEGFKKSLGFNQRVVIDGVLGPATKEGYASMTVTAFR